MAQAPLAGVINAVLTNVTNARSEAVPSPDTYWTYASQRVGTDSQICETGTRPLAPLALGGRTTLPCNDCVRRSRLYLDSSLFEIICMWMASASGLSTPFSSIQRSARAVGRPSTSAAPGETREPRSATLASERW